MRLETKRWIIGLLGVLFLLSLVLVQAMEVVRKRQEAGLDAHVVIPASSQQCIDCHRETTPAIIDHWTGSTHAAKAVGCVECHQAEKDDADAFEHWGALIATVVTPRDCSRCHPDVAKEFAASHHAKGGNILASLDNRLAEVVEGARTPFNPHSPKGPAVTALGMDKVNGLASAFTGCQQCHGSKVALQATEGPSITFEDLKPNGEGKPTNQEAVARIHKDENGRPLFDASTWPNTGIGRLNLDGSRGSCSACHSRHDFSPRRARQPENCGKCHLGPDHPQKEIYEESKHGVAYRDLKLKMNLDAESWVLGKDYSQAPTCATCHMSGHTRNDGKITHDPGMRISWTNRPAVSKLLDDWEVKRGRMKDVCTHCHTPNYVNAFYKQYDDFVVLYNEKFGKPGQQIMDALLEQGLRTKPEFDEEVEWTWFYLWHHEGRRARHGASMMAPDYAHWHGMYEVAERFYMEMLPQTLEICKHAESHGKAKPAWNVRKKIDDILKRPEHQWFPRPELPAEPAAGGG